MTWGAAVVAITVALFGTIGSVMAAVVSSRTRKENTAQHGVSVEGLARVEGSLGALTIQVHELRGDVNRIGERVAVVEGRTETTSSAPRSIT